ncbi:MAG: helix-turn-helix domain-containing protein [Haloferacaceae archaeon]
MVIISEVRFTHERGALVPTFNRLRGLDATVVREASTDPGQSKYVLRFEYDGSSDVRQVIEDDPTVRNVQPMSGFEDQKLWIVEFTDDTRLLNPTVSSSRGVVLDARSVNGGTEPRGWHEHWLLPDREALHTIWQHARDEGFTFEVLAFRNKGRTGPEYPGPAAPTDRQQETLVAAYERGYFAEPRETSLEELAEALDLSPTAVNGRLRRGMKSLVEMTIVVDSPTE